MEFNQAYSLAFRYRRPFLRAWLLALTESNAGFLPPHRGAASPSEVARFPTADLRWYRGLWRSAYADPTWKGLRCEVVSRSLIDQRYIATLTTLAANAPFSRVPVDVIEL
jgi:hypothetical protein